MSEEEYEFECSRAELLGISKPTREEFLASKRETVTAGEYDTEDINTDQNEVWL